LKTCCTISTWRRTRAGLNGISTSFGALFSQSKIFSTSFPVTWKSSQFLIADSRRILIEYGSRSDRRNGQIHGSNHQYFQLTETYKPTKLYGKKCTQWIHQHHRLRQFAHPNINRDQRLWACETNPPIHPHYTQLRQENRSEETNLTKFQFRNKKS